jgi:hypothetical protein
MSLTRAIAIAMILSIAGSVSGSSANPRVRSHHRAKPVEGGGMHAGVVAGAGASSPSAGVPKIPDTGFNVPSTAGTSALGAPPFGKGSLSGRL